MYFGDALLQHLPPMNIIQCQESRERIEMQQKFLYNHVRPCTQCGQWGGLVNLQTIGAATKREILALPFHTVDLTTPMHNSRQLIRIKCHGTKVSRHTQSFAEKNRTMFRHQKKRAGRRLERMSKLSVEKTKEMLHDAMSYVGAHLYNMCSTEEEQRLYHHLLSNEERPLLKQSKGEL